MDHAAGMRVRDGSREHQHQPRSVGWWQALRPQPVFQVSARNEFLNAVVLTGVLANLENPDNALVTEQGRRLKLLAETDAGFGFTLTARSEQFDRHFAPRFGLFRQVDDAHTALTKLIENLQARQVWPAVTVGLRTMKTGLMCPDCISSNGTVSLFKF